MRNIQNSRSSVLLPLFLALAVMLGIFIGINLNPGNRVASVLRIGTNQGNKINRILDIVRKEYVDTVNVQQLSDFAIEAMLKHLDPHSAYIPPVDLQFINEDLQGNFEGVGIEFNLVQDTIVVISVIPGGPSEKAGVKQGDRIVKIDGVQVAAKKIKNEDVFKKLRGKEGTEVKISVARRRIQGLTDISITRGKIPIHSVDAAFMLNPETGYIKVSKFSGTTFDEFSNAMAGLQKQNIRSLVLDLRGNPGGYLDQATDMADVFLKDGQLIVYTEGVHRKRHEYKATSKGTFEQGKLVVLIDEGSASASEILAGAIQDHDRGTILGQRSFGKGLVQEQMEFSDGSALRLTVSRYYTPSGRCIQRPYENGSEAYYDDAMYRRAHPGADSASHTDTTRYFTDNGRIVYGGGGIEPDILIPEDTGLYTMCILKAINSGQVYDFGFDFADRNRQYIRSAYPDYRSFAGDSRYDARIVSELYSWLTRQGIKCTDRRGESLLLGRAKAYIARNVWNTEAFYFVLMQKDPAVRRALEVVR